MRAGNKKIFLEKGLLYTMTNLRLNGFAFTSLAILFNCHISSVEEQCKRYRIVPLDEVYTIERIIASALQRSQPTPRQWEIVNGERISRGRSYSEYLTP